MSEIRHKMRLEATNPGEQAGCLSPRREERGGGLCIGSGRGIQGEFKESVEFWVSERDYNPGEMMDFVSFPASRERKSI